MTASSYVRSQAERWWLYAANEDKPKDARQRAAIRAMTLSEVADEIEAAATPLDRLVIEDPQVLDALARLEGRYVVTSIYVQPAAEKVVTVTLVALPEEAPCG